MARQLTIGGVPYIRPTATPEDVVQVVMTEPVFTWLAEALEQRGMTLLQIPAGEDELTTYYVGLSDQLVIRGNG